MKQSINRILITSCSQRKTTGGNLIPAIERYDGPSFRLLRKYLRQSSGDTDIYILSAKFGLLSYKTRIPLYDHKLSKNHAKDLTALASTQASTYFADDNRVKNVFINLSKSYFEAFRPILGQISFDTSLTIASGTSGRRLSELHDWLYGENSHLLGNVESNFVERAVRFKGVLIRANEVDLRFLVRKGIEDGEAELIRNFQSWFVSIGDLKISPKWLVSKLSGIPVGKFHSDQARRVLQKIGIIVHRV